MKFEEKLDFILENLTELRNRKDPDDTKILESSKILGMPFEELKEVIRKTSTVAKEKDRELIDVIYQNIRQLSSFIVRSEAMAEISQKSVSYKKKDWNAIYNDIYKFIISLIEEDDPLYRDCTLEYCKSLMKDKVREALIKNGNSLEEIARHWVSSVIVTIDQLDQALPHSRSDLTMAIRKMQEVGLIIDTSHKGHIREGIYIFSVRGMRALYLEFLYGDPENIQFYKFIENNKDKAQYEDLIPEHPSFVNYGVIPTLVLHFNNNSKINNSYKYCMLKPVHFYKHLSKVRPEIEDALLRLEFLTKDQEGKVCITNKGIKHIEDIFEKAEYKQLLLGSTGQFTNYDFENSRETGSHFEDIVKKWFYQFIHKNESTSVVLERRQNNSILKGVN